MTSLRAGHPRPLPQRHAPKTKVYTALAKIFLKGVTNANIRMKPNLGLQGFSVKKTWTNVL